MLFRSPSKKVDAAQKWRYDRDLSRFRAIWKAVHMGNSAQVTQNDGWIRRLSSSRFNYYFGYVANFSLVFWLLSRAFVSGQASLSAGQWVVVIASGLLLWTLSEYVLHKWLYHDLPSPLQTGHRLHHDEPMALLGVPWWLTSIILVGIYYGLARVFDPAITGAEMAFVWLGYIGYCAMHHLLHHARWNFSWFVSLRRHHLLHHAKDNVNWGITTDLWDRGFRTKV